ncbi:hypothetical protein J5N97_028646 [Dioscorea zingiberensis]|uniref:Uncharacterized protein n=1 Tax=Dioscorea zingiberensis TaxID=325984 RepID=A0A9D5BZI4_9LILI|nr:hypothetical protein J5N97_028646 [Dioscorea zingiberensis]
MDDPNSGEKVDGLEITSIGTLYEGPWDKKYWSSSRGKDRYPFPVGYQAVRTHSGSTYRMEIREGSKGPLFMVTSADGDSCSGQTPDIVWENYQKKTGVRLKNRTGKRLSSKIDGIELFGFRNPFVQRLLREIVANVGGIAERSSSSSDMCNGAMQLEQEMQIRDSQEYLDLLPYLEKRQSTGKRSVRTRNSIRSISREGRAKRICSQEFLYLEAGTSEQVGETYACDSCHNVEQFREKSPSKGGSLLLETSIPTTPEFESNETTIKLNPSLRNQEGIEYRGMPLLPAKTSIIAERNTSFQATDALPMELNDGEYSIDKHTILFGQSKHADSEDLGFTCMKHELHNADKASDAEDEHAYSLATPTDTDREHPVPDLVRDSNIVPDTLDSLKEDHQESPGCSTKDELVSNKPLLTTSRPYAANISVTNLSQEKISKNLLFSSQHKFAMTDEMSHSVICTPDDGTLCEGMIKDSLPEIGSSSGSSNASLEKMDLYSARQELAKSMMTFLLPRALPLLKKTYERKRSRSRNRETSRIVSALQGSAEQIADIGLPCQDKLAADLPVPCSENKLQEEVDGTKTLPSVGSPCLVVKAEPLGCMAHDPLTETRSLKDVKSVVPDSFEDLIYDVAMNKLLPSAPAQSTCASSGDLKYNTTNPELHIDNGEEDRDGCYLRRHDVCNEAIMLVKDLKKSDIILPGPSCDPSAHYNLVEKVDGECIHGEENIVQPKFGYLSCNQINNIPALGHASAMHNISQQSKGETLHNIGERDLSSECLKGKLPFQNDAAEFSRQTSVLYHNNTNFEEDNILKASVVPAEVFSGSPERSLQISSPFDMVNSDVNATLDAIDAGVRSQVSAIANPLASLCDKAFTSRKANSSDGYMLKASHSTVEDLFDCKMEVKVPHSLQSSSIPLSESIICRNYNQSDVPKMYCNPIPHTTENCQCGPKNNVLNKPPFFNEVMLDNQPSLRNIVGNKHGSEGSVLVAAPESVTKNDHDESGYPVEEILACLENELPKTSTGPNGNVSSFQTWLHHGNHLDGSSSEVMKSEEFPEFMELAGCYLHPNSVLSIFLSTKDDHLKIGVICGLLESAERNLFVYTVPLHEQGIGPSFLGYTSLRFPLLEGALPGDAASEGPGMQFTPDGQSLIFLNSVLAPHCREQNASCSCSKCKADDCDENTIEIVHLEYGYVSSVAKLVTMEKMSCISVCEPNYLIAVEESGRLHVWIMNPTWSSKLEEFNMPGFDYLSPKVLELKNLPSCTSIVIGHNGVGGFGLWDISKRVLLAKYSSEGNKIFQMLPVVGGDRGSAGWWRLALLAKNTVFMGHVFDNRVSVVDTWADYCIGGTCDGLVYMWELSSGRKLANLYPFKCGVSCIKADPKSGTLVVGSNEGQLQVYVQTRVRNHKTDG